MTPKPRRFSLHWGEGTIAEEVRVEAEHHAPTLQLLAFDNGDTAIRFCHYDKRGRFQRSPLIVGEQEIELIRDELQKQPKLHRLLKSLVS